MGRKKRQSVVFQDLLSKPLEIEFSEESISPDGGLPVLKAVDKRLGLSERMARNLDDSRQTGKIQHPPAALLLQRILSFACGYPDGIDFNRLRRDRLWKEITQNNLPSQPTVSRFENAPDGPQLEAMMDSLADTVLENIRARHKGNQRVRRIMLDMDGTDDPTHGQQEFTFFNGFHQAFCYLPLLVFASFNDQPEQYLLSSRLRPGNASAAQGAQDLLRVVFMKLRRYFPEAKIFLRVDAGFFSPEFFDFLEEEKIGYLVAMSKNNHLLALSERFIRKVRRMAERAGETSRVFGCILYSAKSWSRKRRILIKAEVLREPGFPVKENPRFVVTNLPGTPENLYRTYCKRGDSENRIKELKLDCESGRTSCCAFAANQFRLLLASASYVLFQFLRSLLRHRLARRWQVGQLRLRLVKLAVRFKVSARRFLLGFQTDFVGRDIFSDLCRRLAASS